jgi:hypothetical protein
MTDREQTDHNIVAQDEAKLDQLEREEHAIGRRVTRDLAMPFTVFGLRTTSGSWTTNSSKTESVPRTIVIEFDRFRHYSDRCMPPGLEGMPPSFVRLTRRPSRNLLDL